MVSEDHNQSHGPVPIPPPRNLRRIGLLAAAVAIAIAVFGILQRRTHEAEVTQWTQEQADANRRGDYAASGHFNSAPGATWHRSSLV